uniref:Uncharacterized protein n=1 Tax=Batrachochytrium dendrobatidis (strain JAM81 / FGSC 10211) TaxID=684364 RepID=F4PFT2_BATDJ|eukprot:XP_006683465.1 hypothetical protein BATDEDRAFT_93227 [Batrachochytrium dendrobatidis JAM81]
MAMDIRNIDWSKIEIVIPAFLTIIMMPLTSSVAMGLAFGFILYPLALLAQKRYKEIHPIIGFAQISEPLKKIIIDGET